jgi:hypothetical protein
VAVEGACDSASLRRCALVGWFFCGDVMVLPRLGGVIMPESIQLATVCHDMYQYVSKIPVIFVSVTL